ncbi:hypothetical protein [Hymenobacter volaticus]|uniref:SH3 domain-containing protein n=1 Tax=Hymenobacter volaticus TaxID=2932254 RepID=A0ABY4G8E1_9BACT|nr:hypothetical protein [Hymenobacter volaticus]UOQ67167.1 hypothetical protein MUN86_04490 [Hymenobacter volaticus]
MRKTLYLLLISMVLGAFTFDFKEPVGTRVYVINLTGAELHEQPSFKSKTVRKVPLGSAVDAQQLIASDDVKPVGTGLALPGDWIKVATPQYTGYVFSSDVTKIKPKIKKAHDGMLYVDLLGPKRSDRTEKHRVASGDKNAPADYVIDEITEYANSTYTTTAYDGCFDHTYVFRRLALNEVYHHMISSYSGYSGYSSKKLMQPKLLSKKGNVYTFTCGFGDTDAAQELKLTVNKNGSITISSYSCT